MTKITLDENIVKKATNVEDACFRYAFLTIHKIAIGDYELCVDYEGEIMGKYQIMWRHEHLKEIMSEIVGKHVFCKCSGNLDIKTKHKLDQMKFDEDDRIYIAVSINGKCEFILSEDRDFTDIQIRKYMKEKHDIEIVSSQEFIEC